MRSFLLHNNSEFFNTLLSFCHASLYHIVNIITWSLLYLRIQDNQILRKVVPVTLAMGSYIVPETIKIRVGGGADGTCKPTLSRLLALFTLVLRR